MLTPIEFDYLMTLLPAGLTTIQDGDGNLSFPGATAEEQAAAEAIVAAFDPFDVKRAEATKYVNEWTNRKLVSLGVFPPELFYALLTANVALLLLDWKTQGEPEEPDPTDFRVTYAEAQAYREAHAGQGDAEETMTAADLLRLQRATRDLMQSALAPVGAARRYALERIKLAISSSEIATVLAGLE